MFITTNSVLSLRPDLVPYIRLSTAQYVYSLLPDDNIAVRDKKGLPEQIRFGCLQEKQDKNADPWMLVIISSVS